MRALTMDEVGVVGGMRELTAEEIECVNGGLPIAALYAFGKRVAESIATAFIYDSVGGYDGIVNGVERVMNSPGAQYNEYLFRDSPGY